MCNAAEYADPSKGIDVAMGPSDVQLGATNVVIFARDIWDVQRIVEDLSCRYMNCVFTTPVKAYDNKWGVMGRVWNFSVVK